MILRIESLPSFRHVVIIGNGFDLNLGLPTSYSDFMKSEEFTSEAMPAKNNLLHQLKSIHDLNNWIDVENSLPSIANQYTGKEPTAQFKREFTHLKTIFGEYLSAKVTNHNIDQSSKAYSFIQNIDLSNTIFINFNYTNILSDLISEFAPMNNKRIIHIHGNYSRENLILGIQDGVHVKSGQEFIIKSLHQNYVGFNLNRLLKNASHLTVFGHSLGQTDEMYFKEFFQDYSSTKENFNLNFDLYFHDENSFDALMARINALTNGSVGKFRQNVNFNTISSM